MENQNNPSDENVCATPDEWRWAAWHFGPDLLPAVADASAVKTRTGKTASRMVQKIIDGVPVGVPVDLSKIPSVLDASGRARAISGWPLYTANSEDLAKWMRQPAHNILLNTRNVRAIDIDVDDCETADYIESVIVSTLGVQPLKRYRLNGGRRTLMVRLTPNPPQTRRQIILPDGKGMIEFLADSRQTVLLGRHHTGAKLYVKHHQESGGTVTVPHEAMCEAWDALRRVFHDPKSKPLVVEGEAAGRMLAHAGGEKSSDPVLEYLKANNLVLSYEASGMVNVRCPWEHEHTPGSGSESSTSWIPVGVRGRASSGFRCQHTHCADRKAPEFMHAIGMTEHAAVEAFTPVSVPSPVAAVMQAVQDMSEDTDSPIPPIGTALAATEPSYAVSLEDNEDAYYALVSAQLEQAGRTFYVKNGKRVAGPANIAHITRGIPSFLKVKYDRFEERLMCKLRNESSWREYSDNFRTLVREEIEREYGMTFATTDVASAIHAAGEAHAYDSAQQWLTSQTWDGVPRIKNFASDILKSIGDAYGQALGFYLWVALAARVLAPGVKADMTPVLISPLQGTGKSSLVASLAPFRDWFTDAISLDERDEESSRKLKGKTVVEIPELRGLQSRDAESIKAWMTKQIETWIPKYKETKVDYPRRCIFVGTDNRLRFLSDPSGNRRFLPIRVATQARYIDWPTLKRDVNQYWAEAVSIIRGFNTVDEAVDHYSKVADALAGPSRTAATMLDECHDEIKRLVSIQAEGAPITVRAIRSALNLYATNDRFRIEHTLRLLGYEQIDNTVEWAKKQVSVFL